MIRTRSAAPLVEHATASGAFGLYRSADFRIVHGACGEGGMLPPARWYFRDETIAVALPGLPLASFTPGLRAFDDVLRWAATSAACAPLAYPPLVWVAAARIVRNVEFDADPATIATGAGRLAWQPIRRHRLNRSYFDDASLRFFAQHPTRIRGDLVNGALEARSLWPESFRIGPLPPDAQKLAADAKPALQLRALMREAPHGGALSRYAVSTLWQRSSRCESWDGLPVLAFIVNGAQGDDDEAHGGHLAIVTGRIAADGDIGDWLVNNFYALDTESEKGILAAPVPLDNYLGDLNAGQSWYRPSYLLVAVLRDARAAVRVQGALNRVYNQFYRHQLTYYHPADNCASISVDTLRALGWTLALRGASSRMLAWLTFPLVAIRERSIDKAKASFDYLHTDQTRLLPAAALEEIFTSLLALARDGVNPEGELAVMLAQDVDAIAFARVPQFPSSRAIGDAPAVTTAEYRSRLPRDPAQLQLVPVPPRPFPVGLRDADLLPRPVRPSDVALIIWGIVTVVGIPWFIARGWRAWRTQRGS